MTTTLPSAEAASLIEQVRHIADGLAKTFAPFCEVALHDLRDPGHPVLAVYNDLSSRIAGATAGDTENVTENNTAAEPGLACLSDSASPQVIANYPSQFPDGRPAKRTAIGIRDAAGNQVAALCLNVDLTLFRSMQGILEQFNALGEAPLGAAPDPANADAIRRRIDAYAAGLASSPQLLKAHERRALMRALKEGGFLEVRRAMEVTAAHLGISRATAYNDIK